MTHKIEIGQAWFHIDNPNIVYIITRIFKDKAYHMSFGQENLFDNLTEDGRVTTALLKRGWHYR